MPNWCNTSITFQTVDNSQQSYNAIKSLYDNINKYLESDKDVSLYPNSFHNGWLGNQVLEYGLASVKDNNFTCECECRGCIENIDDEISSTDDKYYFMISQYAAWIPMVKMWQEIIMRHYVDNNGNPYIHVYYQAEEPGCVLYWTNDNVGYFYPELYTLDCCLSGKSYLFDNYNSDIEYEQPYFNSDKEALEFINRNITSKEFNTPQQAIDWINNELDTNQPAFTRVGDSPNCDYINLNEFEYCEIDDTERIRF